MSVFVGGEGAAETHNRQAITALSAGSAEVYLLAASSWEISIKFALRSLRLPSPPSQFIPHAMRVMALRSLDITHFHSLAAGELPPHHRGLFHPMFFAPPRRGTSGFLVPYTLFQKTHTTTLSTAQ